MHVIDQSLLIIRDTRLSTATVAGTMDCCIKGPSEWETHILLLLINSTLARSLHVAFYTFIFLFYFLEALR